MTADRFFWILSGLDWERLTQSERKTIEQMKKNFETKGILPKDTMLEAIYRRKQKQELWYGQNN
jgi:hypothetical protein